MAIKIFRQAGTHPLQHAEWATRREEPMHDRRRGRNKALALTAVF